MTGPAAQGRPANLRAIGLMLAATVAFTAMHAMIRHVAQGLHPFEVAFFRNLFGLAFLAPWLFRYGLAPFRTSNLRLHGLRSILNLVSMLCFFSALTLAPLADVTAITFTAPIFACALAAPLLRESVGKLRWAAVALGFAGTLVVLRPGIGEIGAGPLLAVTAALLWGAAILVIKRLTRSEPSVTITAYMMIFLAPMSLAAAIPFWTWPSMEQCGWMLALAAFGTAGHLFLNQALKEGETSVVTPVDFVRLVWAAVIGYLVFGELPDAMTWAGGAMICASAGMIAWREGRKRKAA